MYKTILVPVDISEDELTEKALQHAVYIAKLEGLRSICFMLFLMFHVFQLVIATIMIC